MAHHKYTYRRLFSRGSAKSKGDLIDLLEASDVKINERKIKKVY